MLDKTDDYASFLLCLWLGSEEGAPVWRSSLESTRESERHHFRNLDELIKFLKERFGDTPAGDKHQEK